MDIEITKIASLGLHFSEELELESGMTPIVDPSFFWHLGRHEGFDQLPMDLSAPPILLELIDKARTSDKHAHFTQKLFGYFGNSISSQGTFDLGLMQRNIAGLREKSA